MTRDRPGARLAVGEDRRPPAFLGERQMNTTPPKTTDDRVKEWAVEFDATEAQVHEAIDAVGTDASDIELELKGSRSSTHSDRMLDAGVEDSDVETR